MALPVAVNNPGRFGEFGGRYVPETLMAALEQLQAAYGAAQADPEFQEQLTSYLTHYVGRPTPLYYAARLSEQVGGARIYLKREDLNHTGAHKINNTMGQILLARRMGKSRIIAETGAGQHGVATATVCALFGLECVVYMGEADMARQAPNVQRMELLGARVVPVGSGAQTLKDATNEAIRDWVARVEDTHYVIGSVVGPHPYPTMVRDFQSVIGQEARAQMLAQTGRLPTAVVACVGGGSNALGIFHGFLSDHDVALFGVEGAGHGVQTGRHAAALQGGSKGVLHGAKTYVLQDDDGQIVPAYSMSAGLDYPAVGPEHSYLRDVGRATYGAVTDGEALDAFRMLSSTEGIVPALESAHALAYGIQLAQSLGRQDAILVNVSGRGDKDITHVIQALKTETIREGASR